MKSKRAIELVALTIPLVVLGCFSIRATYAAEVNASASEGVALTIYNQNFGLVKDVRKVQLQSGINYLRFGDVAAAIDPTSVNFMSLTAPNAVAVREQNYQYDVMAPDTVLGKSIGKRVTFRQYSGGVEKTVSGILLNAPQITIVDTNGNPSTRSQGLVVQSDSGIVLNPHGQAELEALPPGLVSKPSLTWKLEAGKAGEHRTEISYQTSGMNWRADYVAIANADDTATDITSWVTIDNKSGATYPNASLKLLAGDVHRVTTRPPLAHMRAKTAELHSAVDKSQFSEKAFAEYHLYTLAGTTNVNDNETKQLSLFNAANIPTKKQFVYEPAPVNIPYYGRGVGRNTGKVNVKLEVANSEKNNLGIPLPKGKVRVYKKDHDGALQFIGEDMIDHTPRDEKIRLYIGDAFDLVGERKQMNSQVVNPRVHRATYEISLRNHKDSAVTITAVEHSYGDWKVLNSSHKHVKKDSHTFEFPVEVPARGEVKVTYEIEIRT